MSAFKKLLPVAVAAAAGGFGSHAQAGGFGLIEQNASGIGNAYAGQAASAQDASTIFFNPAGMTQLPGRQVVVAGHLIDADRTRLRLASLAHQGEEQGGHRGRQQESDESYPLPVIPSDAEYGAHRP